jgi:hypothetical protein
VLDVLPRNRRQELRDALKGEARAERAYRAAPPALRESRHAEWVVAMRLVVHCARQLDAELSP